MEEEIKYEHVDWSQWCWQCMWKYFIIKYIKTYHDEVVSGGPSSSFMQNYIKNLTYTYPRQI